MRRRTAISQYSNSTDIIYNQIWALNHNDKMHFIFLLTTDSSRACLKHMRSKS